MKVNKNRVKPALDRAIKALLESAAAGYEKQLIEKVESEAEYLANAVRNVAKEKRDLAVAKNNLSKFNSSRKVAQSYLDRNCGDYERLLALGRKLEFCEGDVLNLTDSELALL